MTSMQDLYKALLASGIKPSEVNKRQIVLSVADQLQAATSCRFSKLPLELRMAILVQAQFEDMPRLLAYLPDVPGSLQSLFESDRAAMMTMILEVRFSHIAKVVFGMSARKLFNSLPALETRFSRVQCRIFEASVCVSITSQRVFGLTAWSCMYHHPP